MFIPKKISPIIKLTNKCNLTCEFCHYSKCIEESYIDIELCKTIIEQSIQYNYSLSHDSTRITFHGGEPLLLGLSFFEKIIEHQEIILKKYNKHIIKNCIQTNGVLLNDEWIDFFKNNNFCVGISIDGDEEMNFHTSKSYNLNKIINNYKKMFEMGIECGILSVITSAHSKKAKDYYDFLLEHNIKNVGLRYCYNKENDKCISNMELLHFLVDFYNNYYYKNNYLYVREFTEITKKIMQIPTFMCEFRDRCFCGEFLTFDERGNVFFCDVTYDKGRIIDNIKNISLLGIINSNNYQKEKELCMNNIKKCRECSVYDVCGGGCFRHDNECGKNYFCKTYKVFYEYIKKQIKNIF